MVDELNARLDALEKSRNFQAGQQAPPEAEQQPRLILHFDVNETIMLGDPAGGDTFEDTLNKIVGKNAWVSLPAGSGDPRYYKGEATPATWYDGTPLDSDRPPALHLDWEWPPHCAAAYRHNYFKKWKKTFTEAGNPGQHYRGLYEQMDASLSFADPGAADPRLCHDGKHHFLIPAFFHTITELAKQGREFTIVIRTFGTDVDDVAAAIGAYAEGKHVFAPPPNIQLPETVWHGKYQPSGNFVLTSTDGLTISDESEAVERLEAKHEGPCVVRACTDDYQWWSTHGCRPDAGKPMWLTSNDKSVHHIFFDDNIHNIPDDSIVAIRARTDSTEGFEALDGESTLALHGLHLVRVPTICPVLDVDYFLNKINECEAARKAK